MSVVNLQKAERELAEVASRIDALAKTATASAAHVTKLAAKTLKATAPAVAQQLCHRIASRAQRLFNQINQEPIEDGRRLTYCAEHSKPHPATRTNSNYA
jgi:hypothetical protein